ncbi:MAG: ABC transporter permease [Bacteroidetes bacterium]|nr:ABC transporter permease [Bacteroidota bacterium]
MNLWNLVWTEMWHRKARLVSGIMTITLGIAVIVGIRTVSSASEEAVAIKLDNLGANIMVLPLGASTDDYYAADIDAPTFPQEYVDRIVQSALPGVDNLSPKLSRRVQIDGKNIVLTGILPASEITAKPLWQASGLMGNTLDASCAPSNEANQSLGYADERLQRKVIDTLREDECYIGPLAAASLHVRPGGFVSIGDEQFKVTKVLPETGTVDDGRIFAHINSVQRISGLDGQLSAIEIMGCCNAISDGLLGKLRNILPDTRITTIGQIVSTQIETNRLMDNISFAFLIIILIVGGISIGNYTWANVNERKREIGILRMLGFSHKRIYAMILLKAIVFAGMGGIGGYAIGTAAGMMLGTSLAGLDISPVLILLPMSLLLASTISLAGAALPARLASRIEPYTIMQED